MVICINLQDAIPGKQISFLVFDKFIRILLNSLARGMILKLYTSVGKGLKLKVKKIWGLSTTFVEITEEKLVGGPF